MKFRLIEADGNDSFEAAQQYYASLETEEQTAKIEEITNKFQSLGFDRVSIEQLIPDEKYNMYFVLSEKDPEDNLGLLKDLIENTLKDFGTENILFHQADILSDGSAYFHGPFYLEGMTLHD